MSVDRLINLLVTITLMEMMVTVGLRVTFSEIVETAKDWQLVVRALLANYVAVPVVAILLLLLFHAPPLVAAGFVILAVCPGAPFGPPFAAIARANVPMAVGLMVILAGSSAVISPLLLKLLLPWLSDGEAVQIEPLGLVATLLISQLLPLLAGLLMAADPKAFRTLFPARRKDLGAGAAEPLPSLILRINKFRMNHGSGRLRN